MNLNYKVFLNGKKVSTEEYLNSIREFYKKRHESKIFIEEKNPIRFTFMSEGIVVVNPTEKYANLILYPRNEEWVGDLEELANINNRFELEAKLKWT